MATSAAWKLVMVHAAVVFARKLGIFPLTILILPAAKLTGPPKPVEMAIDVVVAPTLLLKFE
jgi:hypothetical protein